MARSPSTSTGTLPTGLTSLSARLKSESASKESKRTITSSKVMPAWRISTQGRMDQDE
jgi:hypothetical protein